MATYEELQTRLDNKTFDTSKLNPEQRSAVDLALQSGKLKGYASVDEIERERAIGSKLVAKQKEKRAQPFTEATKGISPFSDEGITRSDLELTGDVAGGGIVYIKDMPKIVSAFQKDPQSSLGIDKIRAAATKFDKLERALDKLPRRGAFGLLANTARSIARVMDGFRTVAKAPSQLLVTEAKAQLASAGGAGAGSVLYDIANVATDFQTAANNDLGNISNNQIQKLPYAQQVLVHSTEAMRNALYFNLFGSSLAPILGTTLRGFKGILGLGPESKALAEAGLRRGAPLSAATVAQEEKLGGRFVRFFEKVFGVFPFANVFAKSQRARVEKQLFTSMLDEVISKAPLEHLSMLQYQFLPALQKNFMDYQKTIRSQFTTLDTIAQKMNNPAFIPTKELKEVAESYIKSLEEGLPRQMVGRTEPSYSQGIPEYMAAKMKGSGFDDALIDVVNKIRFIDDQITPREYEGIMRALTRNLATTTMMDPQRLAFSLRTAAKNGYNLVGNPDNVQAYLNSSNFKQQYDDILESTGKEAAENFRINTMNDMKKFYDELEIANAYMSTVIGPRGFGSATARKVINKSSNIFSVKGVMNQLPVKVTPDKMWDNVLKTEFTNGSADGIKELRYLFGVDNPNFKAGNELFNRARSRYIWDAFFKSFDKQPEIAGKTIADRMADAERMGAVNFAGKQDIFEMAGTKDLEAITRLDPVLAQRYKLGEVNAMDYKIKAGEAGKFNIKKFREAMGYTDEASKEASMAKWTEMFGGGTQGRAAANDLREMIDLLDAEYGKLISDSQQFIMRRLILGGSAAGAFIAAGGTLATAIPFAALLGMGGYLLSSPKALSLMLDVYTDMQRFDKLGKTMSPTNMPKSMMRLLNYLAEEDKDFPNVDPKKVDFEEVTDYLINKNILVPELGFTPQTLRPSEKDRMYPELETIDRSSQEEDVAGVNYLDGFDRGGAEATAVANARPQQAYVPPPAYQTLVDPQYLGGQVTQPINQQQYQSLFPNDPLGQAIANQPNRGQ